MFLKIGDCTCVQIRFRSGQDEEPRFTNYASRTPLIKNTGTPHYLNTQNSPLKYVFVNIYVCLEIRFGNRACICLLGASFVCGKEWVVCSGQVCVVGCVQWVVVCNWLCAVGPPENGVIALWPNTRVVKCEYCVPQQRNEAKWFNVLLVKYKLVYLNSLLTFIFKFTARSWLAKTFVPSNLE